MIAPGMAALLMALGAPQANTSQSGAAPTARAGDTFELTRDRQSATEGPNGSSSSTSDRDTLIERVMAVRSDGVELEYALPKDATAGERGSQWQFPARLFRPFAGPAVLLDRPALERRVGAWLKGGGMTGAACGHLNFTWNAFRIECDPQSIIGIVDSFNPQPPDARDGAMLHDADATGPARIVRRSAGDNGSTLVAEMILNPEVVRRQLADTDVGVGEITRKPVSLDDALRAHATDDIAGTITTTFAIDAEGWVRRRTRVTRYTVSSPGKGLQTEIVTETLDRTRVR